MARLFLSLGSNLGSREEMLNKAIAHIEKAVGQVLSCSSFYETEPWGFSSSNGFLNACLCVETAYSPMECLQRTQDIEKRLGRKKKSVQGYSDREIDIDLLFYDDWIVQEPTLTIPHPLIQQRAFVLEPLCEIAGQWIHPVLGQSVEALKNHFFSK